MQRVFHFAPFGIGKADCVAERPHEFLGMLDMIGLSFAQMRRDDTLSYLTERLLNFHCWCAEPVLARLRWLAGLAICIPRGDSISSAEENRMGIGPGIIGVCGAVVADDFPVG